MGTAMNIFTISYPIVNIFTNIKGQLIPEYFFLFFISLQSGALQLNKNDNVYLIQLNYGKAFKNIFSSSDSSLVKRIFYALIAIERNENTKLGHDSSSFIMLCTRNYTNMETETVYLKKIHSYTISNSSKILLCYHGL